MSMPTVRDVLSSKSPGVQSTSPDATVLDAVNQMNEFKIGALVVMDGDEVVGMFTERDVLRRVVGDERSPSTTTVGQVMTREVVCCGPDADLDDVSALMKKRRIRHVPVCANGGKLLGMVSIGDVNACNATNQETTIHFLNEYIYGRA
jgi:CBS domain-containing protein